MRIGITATHGRGKSSLLEHMRIYKINEVARIIMGELGKLPQDMNEEELILFQKTLLHRQIKEETLAPEFFITDRIVIDILAYSEGLPIYEDLKKLVKGYLEAYPYDIVFYIPIEFELVSDGVRFEGLEFQKEIDRRIVSLLEEFNIDYITITGSIEERVKEINKHIGKL